MTLEELFVKKCLNKKEKILVSKPMNTKHQAMFDAFKKGVEMTDIELEMELASETK